MNWWWNESRLLVQFCFFFGPLVYEKTPMNSTLSVPLSIIFCLTLFSRNPRFSFFRYSTGSKTFLGVQKWQRVFRGKFKFWEISLKGQKWPPKQGFWSFKENKVTGLVWRWSKIKFLVVLAFFLVPFCDSSGPQNPHIQENSSHDQKQLADLKGRGAWRKRGEGVGTLMQNYVWVFFFLSWISLERIDIWHLIFLFVVRQWSKPVKSISLEQACPWHATVQADLILHISEFIADFAFSDVDRHWSESFTVEQACPRHVGIRQKWAEQ